MVDWGTVPAWIGALGSVLVALVIGGGLLYEIHQRRLSDNRAAAERLDAAAAPARLVSCSGGIAKSRGGRLSIRNDGDGPIRNLDYMVVSTNGAGEERRIGVRSSKPLQTYVGAHAELRVDLIVPEVVDPKRTSIEVEFTDHNGLRWALTSGNELRPVRFELEDDQ